MSNCRNIELSEYRTVGTATWPRLKDDPLKDEIFSGKLLLLDLQGSGYVLYDREIGTIQLQYGETERDISLKLTPQMLTFQSSSRTIYIMMSAA